MKKILKIEGMHCANCALTIEKALKKTKGVSSAVVNYASEKAVVEFDESKASESDLNNTVKSAGYSVAESHGKHVHVHEHKETLMNYKILVGAIFSAIVFFGSFPEFFGDFFSNTFLLLFLATIVQFWVGYQFHHGFWIALKNKTADMNTLVSLGTNAAYFYSLYQILSGNVSALYLDTSALIITLILVGRFLEAKMKGKASSAIKNLLHLQAKNAHVLRNGKEVEIPVEEVVVGDIFLVKAGEKIPVDGVVLEGNSSIDESMVSGESIPVEKEKGSKVVGSTISLSGFLKCRAEKVGKDTLLSRIVQLVEEAQGSKAPIQRLADIVSSYFVPIVIAIALLSFAFWFLIGEGFVFSFTILIAVLIIACPCALGLATPTAIMIGMGKGAQNGILIKNAQALEKVHTVNAVVFDKTGTLTEGKPKVQKLYSSSERLLLEASASVEKASTHPLAEAIVNYAVEKNIHFSKISNFKNIAGKGVSSTFKGKKLLLGNLSFLKEQKIDVSKYSSKALELQMQGNTVVGTSLGKEFLGIIAVSDSVKDSAQKAVYLLMEKNLQVFLLTGDNETTARAVAEKVGILKENVLSNVLPEQKSSKIKELQEKGLKVAMVGDGINDAPALAVSDLGIAVGSGTDVALEAGEIVLVKSNPVDVFNAFSLSSYTLKKIKQNLFFAFIYNIALIPVAAGILFSFGILLNPIFAASAMALSSITVVGNSLAMNSFKF